MNYQLILNIIKNLISQPKVETMRLASENKSVSQVFKEIIIPFIIAIILAQFIGNVIFGRYYFSQILNFLTKVTAPIILILTTSALLYTILLNEILQYFSLPNKLTRTFYIITYAFIPVMAVEFASGLLPKLRPMLTLLNIYSYYILWLLLKVEYTDISKQTHRKVALTAIISMALLHWAIVACINFLL